MAKRLGEILIERGVIDEEQLKKALDAQLIYGAHLGTCLIELGYLDEEVLGRTLAETFHVEYARGELLEEISPAITEKLPEKVVEQYQAVPFDLKGKILQVAMTDPRNLHALDALRFISGHQIRAWVAPEVRIFQAMERYYSIPRRLRYITLCARLDEKKPKKKTAKAVMTAAQGAAPGKAPASRAKTTEVAVGGSAALVPLRKVETEGPPPEQGSFPVDNLAKVSEEICLAEKERDAAAPVMRHAATGLARCILFRVMAGVATVWDAQGVSLAASQLRRVRFEVSSEPVFSLLFGEPYYIGPLIGPEKRRGFYDTLGMELPSEVLIVPGYVNDSLSVLFYGDILPGGSFPLPTEDYRRLTQKLALALNVIELKRKIRCV